MKGLSDFFHGAAALTVAAFAAAIALAPAHAQDVAAPTPKPNCTAPSELTRVDYALKRVSQ